MGLPDQVTLPYSEGFDIGLGVNYASAKPKNRAVTGDITPPFFSGDIVGFEIKRVQSSTEIEDTLGISVEASYGSAAFGAGASGRFNFVKNAKVQSSSLVMLVNATVKRAFQQIDEPSLTGPAGELVGNPTVFGQRYGNMFVRGMQGGGLFIGYIRIDTGSSDVSSEVSAQLEGSYGLFSADAISKFKKIQREFRRDVAINMYHEGGPTGLHIDSLDDPMELLRNLNLFLQSFVTQPDQVSIPYSVTIAPLAIANGPLPPDEAQLEHAQDVLRFCVRLRSASLDKLNTYQHIVDNPGRFDYSNGADESKIRSAVETLQYDLDLIARCASHAMNSPAEAKYPAPYAESIQESFPKTVHPELLPIPIPRPPTTKAMWDFVGMPAEPVISLMSCIQLEGVDHCLSFLGDDLSILGPDVEPMADFFFLVLRNGVRFQVQGNSSLPGATIKAQFPPMGVELIPGSVAMLDCRP